MKKSIPAFFSALAFSASLMAADAARDMPTINVNTATAEELDKGLIGVGKKTASEIVSFREEHGLFTSLEDLDKVKYVGDSLLEKNKDRIVFIR